MAEFAAAVGVVVLPVAGITLAIGAQQHAEAIHLAVIPRPVETVAAVGGQNARAVESSADGFAVIAPALAPAGDHMTIRDHAMDEIGGEALGLALMAESGGGPNLRRNRQARAGANPPVARARPPAGQRKR